MNNRLLQFLAAENINQSQFADSIGVARASISHILSGRNKPGFDFIENTMKRYPALNIEWLLTGRGRMFKTQEMDDVPSLFDSDSKFAVTDSKVQDSPSIQSGQSKSGTSLGGRRVSKIIIMYDDNTFQELVDPLKNTF